MKIKLQYGKHGLSIDLASKSVTLLAPKFLEGLPDEEGAFQAAVSQPIEALPLKELIGPTDKVAVVVPDLTRPLPSDRLLPWLFAVLAHVPARNFVIINGTGSHRINTDLELAGMVGSEVFANYRVINHNSHERETMTPVGKTFDGSELFMNKEYVQADKRIVLGFIEPHFMAGFSGGYKAVFPGVADVDSIVSYHRASVIADSRSSWGVLEGNPTQDRIRANGSLVPVDFCINVTLNNTRQITGFFCGDVLAAHNQGCKFAKETAMVACPQPFPIVVTTNGGYPLDQNLYQAVKGMSAAAQIVMPDGLILAAAKCNDGFPAHGNFRKLLMDHASPQAILDTIMAPGFSMYDQWEAQLLAMVLIKARVALYSDLPAEDVRRAHLIPVSNLEGSISAALERVGGHARIAILPEGPMTIPYLTV